MTRSLSDRIKRSMDSKLARAFADTEPTDPFLFDRTMLHLDRGIIDRGELQAEIKNRTKNWR
jgi:hypothetical protein